MNAYGGNMEFVDKEFGQKSNKLGEIITTFFLNLICTKNS